MDIIRHFLVLIAPAIIKPVFCIAAAPILATSRRVISLRASALVIPPSTNVFNTAWVLCHALSCISPPNHVEPQYTPKIVSIHTITDKPSPYWGCVSIFFPSLVSTFGTLMYMNKTMAATIPKTMPNAAPFILPHELATSPLAIVYNACPHWGSNKLASEIADMSV
jgi:hypothetical protein